MNKRPRFGIRWLLVATAFFAIAIAWWRDHRRLTNRIDDAQLTSELLAAQNSKLRKRVRSDHVNIDTAVNLSQVSIRR